MISKNNIHRSSDKGGTRESPEDTFPPAVRLTASTHMSRSTRPTCHFISPVYWTKGRPDIWFYLYYLHSNYEGHSL